MTKSEFKHKYKDGLNAGMVLFQKTLHTVMTTEEIDKVIDWANTRKEKKWLKNFKEVYREKAVDWDSIPFWGSFSAIESISLLRDVLGIMVLANKNTYHGENEKDDADAEKPKTKKQKK